MRVCRELSALVYSSAPLGLRPHAVATRHRTLPSHQHRNVWRVKTRQRRPSSSHCPGRVLMRRRAFPWPPSATRTADFQVIKGRTCNAPGFNGGRIAPHGSAQLALTKPASRIQEPPQWGCALTYAGWPTASQLRSACISLILFEKLVLNIALWHFHSHRTMEVRGLL